MKGPPGPPTRVETEEALQDLRASARAHLAVPRPAIEDAPPMSESGRWSLNHSFDFRGDVDAALLELEHSTARFRTRVILLSALFWPAAAVPTYLLLETYQLERFYAHSVWVTGSVACSLALIATALVAGALFLGDARLFVRLRIDRIAKRFGVSSAELDEVRRATRAALRHALRR
jgi:hypothetical protein